MAIDAIVRVSFQSDTPAHQSVGEALVGSGVFTKVNTAVYRVRDGADAQVLAALTNLFDRLETFPNTIDYVSLTLTRTDKVNAHASDGGEST